MAQTHKSLKAAIDRAVRVVVIFIDEKDADQAGFVAKFLARDGFKMKPELREND